MRTINILNLIAFAAAAKRIEPLIAGCPCLQDNTCLPDSDCRIAHARARRGKVPLNRLDKYLLRVYGTGECLNCKGSEASVVPNVAPVEDPQETVYVYRPQAVVQAIPEYVMDKPVIVQRRQQEMIIPKSVNVPIQYVEPPRVAPQRIVEVVAQPSVVKTVTVPIKPTPCQRRRLRAAANQAAKGLEYIDACPQCANCGQEVIPQPANPQPTLYRRTTTTETDAGPVEVIEATQPRRE